MRDTDWSYGSTIQAYNAILEHTPVWMSRAYWWRFLFHTIPTSNRHMQSYPRGRNFQTIQSWSPVPGTPGIEGSRRECGAQWREGRLLDLILWEVSHHCSLEGRSTWQEASWETLRMAFSRLYSDLCFLLASLKYDILARELEVLAQELYCSRRAGWSSLLLW